MKSGRASASSAQALRQAQHRRFGKLSAGTSASSAQALRTGKADEKELNLRMLNSEYWNERWLENATQWDIGYPSPAIVEFVNGLPDKSMRILIPGCGNAYEAEYLHNNGFTNVIVADYAEEALRRFADRVPSFPKEHLIVSDFFKLQESGFDLVIEQTFFCAIDPSLREKYADKMKEIISENGVLAGLLFIQTPNDGGPPFNGTIEEYQTLFGARFTIRKMEPCTNSIPPRAGRELWFEVVNNR